MRGFRPSVLAVLLCTLATFVHAPSHAQGFQAVNSKDGTDVWAVGDNGVVYRSLVGGTSYASQQLGIRTLRAIAHRGLNVIVVGDSGYVFRSTDNGLSFSTYVVPGAPVLRAAAFASANRVLVAGDGGAVLRSEDTGATWSVISSGSVEALHALAFSNATDGFAAGANGTLLATTNGGASWTPVPVPTTNDLYALAQNGSTVWAGGAGGALLKSTNGGSSFAHVALKMEFRPDVRALAAPAANEIWVGGGGGFVRRSTDGGNVWTFPTHDLHGMVAGLSVNGSTGFAVSRGSRIVARWSGGTSLAMPSGATVTRSWSKTLGTNGTQAIRGRSIVVNPWARDVIFALSADSLWRSPDAGETWKFVRRFNNNGHANALTISPKDTAQWVAAIVTSGGTRQMWRSTDAGATWTPTLTHAFGEYGIPLERHPDKPDTLLFGGDSDSLQRSVDGGQTWQYYGHRWFRSPCDIIIVPDANQYVLVGDGITGSGIGELFQSEDGGLFYTSRQNANGSEIPGMSCSRLRNNVAFGTTWSATGVRATTDFGKTWPTVTDLNRTGQNVASSWGTDIAGDDPNVVIVGQYSGGIGYLSLDGATTFAGAALAGSNYSFLLRDRGTLLAQQSGGVYKMRFAYAYTPTSPTQSVAVTAPNGGESWDVGSVHNITWSGANLALARIEYRRSASDPWVTVADVEGYAGTYAWTVPNDPTTTAEVRVRDAGDGNPSDVSNATFAIVQVAAPQYDALPALLDMSTVDVTIGEFGAFTISNPGTATLQVTNVTSDNARFAPVRTAFSIAASLNDTLGVWFRPVAAGADSATLTITSNDAGSPHTLKVRGTAGAFLGVGDGMPAAFALEPNAPNPFPASGRTLVRFDVPVRARVRLEVFDVLGHRVATLADGDTAPGRYSIPFGSGTPGVARLRSGMFFVRMTAPGFDTTRRMLVIE
ncbi:MAG: YCF48-related protein [Candidatus Eisenbacteria bacterium]